MITDLLPRYNEAHGNKGTYEILRSIFIDGHEVAWMKYSGTIEADLSGLGREGQAFQDFRLYCECYFTEDIGWKIDKEYGVVGIGGQESCIFFEAALDLRIRELRNEYLAKFNVERGLGSYGLLQYIEEIVTDLFERDSRGEFIAEGGGGAHFYGGHFYLQTLAKIFDIDHSFMFDDIDRLQAEKKITLDGSVVKKYTEPPKPKWQETSIYKQDGYMVRASLPTHSAMRQDYRLDLYDSSGSLVNTEYLQLSHQPHFGPDIEDVLAVEEKCVEMINKALQKS